MSLLLRTSASRYCRNSWAGPLVFLVSQWWCLGAYAIPPPAWRWELLQWSARPYTTRICWPVQASQNTAGPVLVLVARWAPWSSLRIWSYHQTSTKLATRTQESCPNPVCDIIGGITVMELTITSLPEITDGMAIFCTLVGWRKSISLSALTMALPRPNCWNSVSNTNTELFFSLLNLTSSSFTLVIASLS